MKTKIEALGKLTKPQTYKTTNTICSRTRLQGICVSLRIRVAGTSHRTAKTCVELALQERNQGTEYRKHPPPPPPTARVIHRHQ